jgi:hypothetical protein
MNSRDHLQFPQSWAAVDDDEAARDYKWWRSIHLVDVAKQDAKWMEVERMLQESLPSATLVSIAVYSYRPATLVSILQAHK